MRTDVTVALAFAAVYALAALLARRLRVREVRWPGWRVALSTLWPFTGIFVVIVLLLRPSAVAVVVAAFLLVAYPTFGERRAASRSLAARDWIFNLTIGGSWLAMLVALALVVRDLT